MHRQDHLIGCGAVGQRLILVAQPQELAFSVPLADIHAELDQRQINRIAEGIRLFGIRGALDRDRPLVVRSAGGAPRAVLFLDIQTDAAILSMP